MSAQKFKSLNRKSILIVEDDPSARKYLRMILKQSDCAIVEAKDAADAMSKVQDNSVDGMLLDIALGSGKNGLELGADLKAMHDFSKTPMVAVTAYPKENLSDMDERGFTGYLQKPYLPKELLAILEDQFPA